MNRQIIPYNSDSHEIKFFHDRRVKSQVIYIAVVFTVIALILSMPFIKISISVQSRGIVRPVSEIAEIRVIPSAPVSAVYFSEGSRIAKGDTLLILESEGVESKLENARQELQKTEKYIQDLCNLTNQAIPAYFLSDLFRMQHINYMKRISEIDYRIERAILEVVRQKPLFDSQLISTKEYEKLLECRDQLENEKKVIETSQMLQWKSELAKYLADKDSYISQIDQIDKLLDLYVIKSPVNGTIESFAGIYPGCNLQSGQVIAVISPDNTMIAEVYISARNIGLLFVEMPVRFQIDAFNYNEWGSISGRITGISEDYSLINNEPVFKVKCSLDSICLRLKNGTPGMIKKGMTLNARFLIAKRSLFQLLYQKSDDWLNPTRGLAVM